MPGIQGPGVNGNGVVRYAVIAGKDQSGNPESEHYAAFLSLKSSR